MQGRAWTLSVVTLGPRARTQCWGRGLLPKAFPAQTETYCWAQGVGFEGHGMEACWSKVGRIPKFKPWVLRVTGSGIRSQGSESGVMRSRW